jgi:hypothetical protein
MAKRQETTRLGGRSAIAVVLAVLAAASLLPAETTPPQEAGAGRPLPEFSTPQWVTPPVTAPRVRHEASPAVDHWWNEYTAIASVGLRAEPLEEIQPGAARGAGTLGWYGFWFLDAQEQAGYCEAGRKKLQQAGVKRIVYYDLGEIGDHAGFFADDGKMKQTGWSLPWWKGNEPLTARWFGLEGTSCSDSFEIRWRRAELEGSENRRSVLLPNENHREHSPAIC